MNTNQLPRSRTSKTTRLVYLRRLCMLSIGMVISVAQAAPGWFVVNTDTQSIRSGDQEIYYTIHEYNQGTILMIDGISGDYSKVRYPADLGAFVPAREAQQIDNGSSIRLAVESQLRAASMLRGLGGSWCPVFEEPLPAGTEMKVIEVVEENGEVVGYRVSPPKPPAIASYPIAYIRTDSIRAATEDEIADHLAGDLDIKVGQPAKEVPANRPQLMPYEPTPNPDSDDDSTTSNDEGGQGGEGGEPSMTDLREPMVVPEMDNAGDATSDAGLPDDSGSNQTPVVIENTTPRPNYQAPRFVEPGERMSPAALEALEASFINARSMPRAQLDQSLPELLAEFTRTRQAAGDDEHLVRALDQRIEWLNIRIETRNQRQAIAHALASNDEQAIALNTKLEQWNASRVYNLVGRLMLSGIYTGEHLPLLYRVRAPDPITGTERTIGYVAPNPDQDLRRYLGTLVGVVGDPVHDDVLSLMVLSPTRVDAMPGQ